MPVELSLWPQTHNRGSQATVVYALLTVCPQHCGCRGAQALRQCTRQLEGSFSSSLPPHDTHTGYASCDAIELLGVARSAEMCSWRFQFVTVNGRKGRSGRTVGLQSTHEKFAKQLILFSCYRQITHKNVKLKGYLPLVSQSNC